MSLVKGKFVDKTIPIQSDNDPIDVKDLARKGYVDSQAASAADAKVEDQIVNGVTAKAPSQNAVFDALALKQNSLGTGTTSQFLRGDLSWQEVATSVGIAQVKIVSKGGVDATGDGTLTKPYATVGAAMASITDASPTKRYLIKVQAGAYTEGALALKANVFICGDQKEAVRISASSFSLASDFSGSADNRSGMSKLIIAAGNANFDWGAVTSAAGKLYFSEVSTSGSVTLTGHNNAIAQAQFDSCIFFAALTISGINVGLFTNNVSYSSITLNQHPGGGMPTILNAIGGSCGTIRANTTVNDFNRRCSLFLKSFFSDDLIIDGPSSYADADLDSQGKNSTQKLNGGTLVAITSRLNHALDTQMLKPIANNAHNLGDWAKQWMFNFAYVHASSGTDMYLLSAMENYDPAGGTVGRSIFINPDGYGLKANVSGGNVEIETAAVSGTGVRGKVQIKARELDMTAAKITNVVDPTSAQDAATKGYVDGKVSDAIVDGVTTVAPSQNAVYDALALKLSTSLKGANSGLAELDSSGKVPLSQIPASVGAVQSVNTKTGEVVLQTDDIAEAAVPTNKWFTDARAKAAAVGDAIADGVTDKAPSQNAVYDALALKLDQASKGAAGGVAELDGSGKVPTGQLPALAITETYVVASEVAMLALAAQKGDVAIRTDLNKSFILAGTDPTVLADWKELLTPTDAVLSVNGQTGSVSLDSDDVAEGATNKYFSDAAAQAAAVVDSTAGSETDQAASVSAMKLYVAGEISAIPAPAIPQGKKERKVLSSTDITNGYIDCAFEAMAETMMLMTGGVVHNEGAGDDYVLSVVAGKTRITFEPDLAAILAANDDIYLQYLRLV
jgi:hypothetical protein